MLVESLQYYITSQAAITSIIGTPLTRADKMSGVYPMIAASAATLPYIVMQQVFGEHAISFEGTNRLAVARWRFSIYGSPYKATKQLAKVFKDVMVDMPFGVKMPPNKQNGDAAIVTMGTWLKMEADEVEEIPHGTVFATHLDFEINYIDNE